jgi:uncharacterized protein (TIGR02145 family)
MKYLIIEIICVLIIFNSCKKKEVPLLSTSGITCVTGYTAKGGGIIIDEGSGSVFAKGVCWSTESLPTIDNSKTNNGSGSGEFFSNISELKGATKYHVRAYATNNFGTGYGEELTFSTLGQVPISITKPATNIEMSAAILNAEINANSLITYVSFEYGMTTDYDKTITLLNPVTENNNINISADISGLLICKTYHFRVKATNELGTTFGNDVSFKTKSSITFNSNLEYGYLDDNDGNTYKTIKIGTQTWMAENLKTTKYNDGTNIPIQTDNSIWLNLSSPAYCWLYNNEFNNKDQYGALYNWYTIKTGKLCPSGWHIPSYSEWTILTDFLGGSKIAGGKLKEIGEMHWHHINTGATNVSGFTGLPGGCREIENGYSRYDTKMGFWWTSTEYSGSNALTQILVYDSINVSERIFDNKRFGLSVRCIKD